MHSCWNRTIRVESYKSDRCRPKTIGIVSQIGNACESIAESWIGSWIVNQVESLPVADSLFPLKKPIFYPILPIRSTESRFEVKGKRVSHKKRITHREKGFSLKILCLLLPQPPPPSSSSWVVASLVAKAQLVRVVPSSSLLPLISEVLQFLFPSSSSSFSSSLLRFPSSSSLIRSHSSLLHLIFEDQINKFFTSLIYYLLFFIFHYHISYQYYLIFIILC